MSRQIIGNFKALSVFFKELGSHVIEENIYKMEIGMVLRENHVIVVTRENSFYRTTSWPSRWKLMAKLTLADAAESVISLCRLAQYKYTEAASLLGCTGELNY